MKYHYVVSSNLFVKTQTLFWSRNQFSQVVAWPYGRAWDSYFDCVKGRPEMSFWIEPFYLGTDKPLSLSPI